ncbi:MAG TPA: hypothetical protein VM598_07790 [Bdellovibrionota bacterium]|nr:hypothetical protein [Bdellovibrionota bacterium]
MRFQTLLMIPALVTAAAGAETLPKISTDVEAVASLARSLDPVGDRHGRGDVPGAYRTRLGLQIHRSCLGAGGTPADFERWTAGAADLVANRCWNRYPELRYVLGQWISQARRAVVTCYPRSEKNARYGGMNFLFRPGPKDLPREATEGVSLSQFFLPAAFETLVGLPGDRVARDIARPAPVVMPYSAIETLVHELFHSTSVEALTSLEHLRRETVAYRHETACELSAADDPVSYLTSLCTGMSLTSSSLTAEEAAEGRASCKKGCADTIGLVARNLRRVDRAGGEDLARAKPAVCQRATSVGRCKVEASRTLTRHEFLSETVWVRGTVSTALEQVVPSMPGFLQARYLEAESDLEALILKVGPLPCARNFLSRDPAGWVRLAGLEGADGKPSRSLRARLSWIDDSLRYLNARLASCSLAGAELVQARHTIEGALMRRQQMFGSAGLLEAMEEMLKAGDGSAVVSVMRASLARDPRLLTDLGLAERYFGHDLFARLRGFASRLGEADPVECP